MYSFEVIEIPIYSINKQQNHKPTEEHKAKVESAEELGQSQTVAVEREELFDAQPLFEERCRRIFIVSSSVDDSTPPIICTISNCFVQSNLSTRAWHIRLNIITRRPTLRHS